MCDIIFKDRSTSLTDEISSSPFIFETKKKHGAETTTTTADDDDDDDDGSKDMLLLLPATCKMAVGDASSAQSTETYPELLYPLIMFGIIILYNYTLLFCIEVSILFFVAYCLYLILLKEARPSLVTNYH
jgi:hypothetical protein